MSYFDMLYIRAVFSPHNYKEPLTMEREKSLFLSISAYLTGFNELELQGTGRVDTYYNVVLENNDKTLLSYFFEEVAQILEQTQGNEAQTNSAIASRLIPNSAYNGLAKKIIVIWYTGTSDGQTVISAESYIQGLMWEAAETHPAGAKQPGFGSWNLSPFKPSTPNT